MLLSLFSAATYAATALFVSANVSIWEGSEAASGQILLSATGEPRVALYNVNQGPTPSLLVPTTQGWVERPVPRGLLAEGPTDIVFLPQPVGKESRRLTLMDGRWVEIPGSALPEGATGPAAMDRDGRVSVYGSDGAAMAIWTDGADGVWRADSLPAERLWSTFAQGGAVWRTTGTGVSGPQILRRALVDVEGVPTGGLDGRGQPALVWTERGRVRVQHKGGLATLPLPPDISPKPERCLDARCRSEIHWATAAIAASGHVLVVPYVLGTMTQTLQCRPFDGPFHACDPAGPNDTCPEPEKWSCDSVAPETRQTELRIAVVEGNNIQERTLDDLRLPAEATIELWDAAGDEKGRIHILFRVTTLGRSELRYALLSPEATAAALPATLPATLVPAPSVRLDQLSEATLGLSGFATGLSGWAGDAPPAFADGEALTGGSHGAGWWTASLASTPASRPVALEVQLALEDRGACGVPEVLLVRGARSLNAKLTPAGLLVESSDREPMTVPLRVTPTRLRLELGPKGGAVYADGQILLRLDGLDPAIPGGLARFGDINRCPGQPTTATRWQAVRLDR